MMRELGLAFSGVATLFAVATCYNDKDPTLPQPDTPWAEGSAAPLTADEASSPCGKACGKLRDLKCPEGSTTPGGKRCYDVCVGAGELVDPSCVNDAKSVAEVRTCHVRCAP